MLFISSYISAQNAKVIDSPNGTVISNIGGADIPYSSSILDIRSNNKGVLLPRLNADVASPVEGLFYYNTIGHNFRYYDGTAWQNASFGNQWNVNNTDISYSLGNVGIGTNTPVGALDIYNANSSVIHFHNIATGSTLQDGFYMGNVGSTTGYIWNIENAPIRFATNNAERLTITSDGNVGIGYNGPTYKLSVNGTIYSNGDYVSGNSQIIGTATITGAVNANSNLAVQGNITTNSGSGIVRSGNANQMVIEEYTSPNNITYSLSAGETICCIGIGYTTFATNPSIIINETTGTVTNPGNIVYTVDSYPDNHSALIRVHNVGSTAASADHAVIHGMIIGRK